MINLRIICLGSRRRSKGRSIGVWGTLNRWFLSGDLCCFFGSQNNYICNVFNLVTGRRRICVLGATWHLITSSFGCSPHVHLLMVVIVAGINQINHLYNGTLITTNDLQLFCLVYHCSPFAWSSSTRPTIDRSHSVHRWADCSEGWVQSEIGQ